MKLFQKLRDLEAKASKWGWITEEKSVRGKGSAAFRSFLVGPWTKAGGRSSDITEFNNEADAELIAEMRNELPKLLEAIDVATEALKYVVDYEDSLSDPERAYVCTVRNALTRLRELGDIK